MSVGLTSTLRGGLGNLGMVFLHGLQMPACKRQKHLEPVVFANKLQVLPFPVGDKRESQQIYNDHNAISLHS